MRITKLALISRKSEYLMSKSESPCVPEALDQMRAERPSYASRYNGDLDIGYNSEMDWDMGQGPAHTHFSLRFISWNIEGLHTCIESQTFA